MSLVLPVLSWYLAVMAAGVLALPLAFQLFRHLPDRGYSLAKPLGLLTIGYVFWFLGSLGFLRNDVPGLLFAAILVGGLGLAWLRRPGLAELRAWLGQQRGLLLGVEALFLVALGLMAYVRAYNPDIHGTEKPMEFMFINSILQSPAFPPHDAWLSGHAISYYYFGYVIVAALARLTGTLPGVAFNLGLALLFALTAVGALGVVLNLIVLQSSAALRGGRGVAAITGRPVTSAASPTVPSAAAYHPRTMRSAFWPALLGPFLVLVVGNFYGLAQLVYQNGWFAGLEIPVVRYYFGPLDPANYGASADLNSPPPEQVPYQADPPGIRFGWVNVYDWLDLKQTQEPPPPRTDFTWQVGGNYFFGARVVHDRDLLGHETEAIDEMPAFSFILGDMHPHVLALPFVVLAIGLALEWLLWGAGQLGGLLGFGPPPITGGSGELTSVEGGSGKDAGLRWPAAVYWLAALRQPALAARFGLSAIVLGGLGFLNTWDFPIYLFLTALALVLGVGLRWGWAALLERPSHLLLPVVGLAALSVALYFPFYLTFQSQAGGILPNMVWPTRFQQAVVFFGPVLVGALAYSGWLAYRGRSLLDRSAALWAGLGLVGLLVLVVLVLALAGTLNPALRAEVERFIHPLTRQQALGLVLQRRLVDSLTTLVAAAMVGLAAGLFVGALRRVRPPVSALSGVPARERAGQRVAQTVPVAPGAGAAAGPLASAAAGPLRPDRPWRRRAARLNGVGAEESAARAALDTPAVLMALAMLVTGALLWLGPEFVYLRDNFGTRMNTIFKFYFQTWTLWALAAAFGLWHMARAARAGVREVAVGAVILAMAGGLVYTGSSLYYVTGGFAGPPTLDGMAWYARAFPDEWAAIQWLRENVDGTPVIAEAVGGAYQIEESRIAMGTGLPTVMGWLNHEGQWRGEYYAKVAERPQQVQMLYQVRDWNTAEAILDEYGIEYVVVGNEERSQYNPVYVPKFEQHMDTVFESGTLTIYRRKLAQGP